MADEKYWAEIERRCLGTYLDVIDIKASEMDEGYVCAWCLLSVDGVLQLIPSVVTCPHCGRESLIKETAIPEIDQGVRLMFKADRAYLDWLSDKRGYPVNYNDVAAFR